MTRSRILHKTACSIVALSVGTASLPVHANPIGFFEGPMGGTFVNVPTFVPNDTPTAQFQNALNDQIRGNNEDALELTFLLAFQAGLTNRDNLEIAQFINADPFSGYQFGQECQINLSDEYVITLANLLATPTEQQTAVQQDMVDAFLQIQFDNFGDTANLLALWNQARDKKAQAEAILDQFAILSNSLFEPSHGGIWDEIEFATSLITLVASVAAIVARPKG